MASVTKPAQRELCTGCGKSSQGAIPAGPAGTSGATGEVELQVLGAEPAAGTVNCCLDALAWGTAQLHHTPLGMQQSWGEQSAGVWKQLLARPHQESISFLVYSESYSEFTVWD